MYIQILNVVLIIILIGIVIWLSWNIYESTKPVKKYEDPTFEKGENLNKEILCENNLDSVITIKPKKSYKGTLFLKVISLKHFKVDWGNGLEVPYTESNLTQKLGPVGYGTGEFEIKIFNESNSIKLFDIESTNNEFESITFQNCSKPTIFLPKWNIDTIELKGLN